MLKTQRRMTPDEWAITNRVYPKTAAIPGPRDPSLTPYIIPIERAIAARTHRRVVAVFGTQMSKTELSMDVLGHRLDTAPTPMAFIAPSKQILDDEFEPRIEALIKQSDSLRRKAGRKKRTKAKKLIAGVTLRLVHGGSATALAAQSLGLVVSDEVDKMLANVKGQGDVIGLADRRGDAYADFVHFATSSPSRGLSDIVFDEGSELHFWADQDPKEIHSTIWRMWQSGTRYHWAVPCPHCSEYFIPRFRNLKWEKPLDADGKELPSTPILAKNTAHMVCEFCADPIVYEDLEEMNARAVFVAPGQAVMNDGTVNGEEPEAWTLSFWVSGLCSPFVPWGQRAAEYVEAARSGVTDNVQAVVNGMGELFSPGDGDAPEWQELRQLARPYVTGDIPEWVRILTLTCDVQKDRLVYVIRGWGEGASSAQIIASEIFGDTAELDVWNKLGVVLTDLYDGIPIKLALIDSGYRPGKKFQVPDNMVYRFCRRFPKLAYATKGASNPMRKPIAPNKLDINLDGKAFKKGLDIRIIDTAFFKRWLHQKFRWPKDEVGEWVLPEDVSDDFLQQMVSEAEVNLANGKTRWVMRSKHNHFFDCESMQGACAMMLNLHLLRAGPAMKVRPKVVSSAPQRRRPAEVDVDEDAAEPATSSPRRGRAPRKQGWLKRESIW